MLIALSKQQKLEIILSTDFTQLSWIVFDLLSARAFSKFAHVTNVSHVGELVRLLTEH